MVSKSLREWLRVLEQDGVLKHVGREVNLEHELAAVGKKACGTYAVWFDKPIGERLPKDNKIPVVTGICGNRAMFAKAMGVSAREMSGTFSEAQAHPIEPVVVPPGEAPVKAVVTRQVNLYGLPIPVHHEKDSGQYITAGVVVAKDPVTGQRNVSIHRLQVTDKNHLGVSCCRGISWLYREWLKNQEIHSKSPSVLGWIPLLCSPPRQLQPSVSTSLVLQEHCTGSP